MSRKKAPAPMPVDNGLVEYKVAEGVTHVDGKKVSSDTVKLTREQALFDLSLDRISPVPGASA